MLILTMCPGDGTLIDEFAVRVGEIRPDRLRITLQTPKESRVTLMPEGIVVAPRIAVWRGVQQQVHVDVDIQVVVIELSSQRARLGFCFDSARQITRDRVITDECDVP